VAELEIFQASWRWKIPFVPFPAAKYRGRAVRRAQGCRQMDWSRPKEARSNAAGVKRRAKLAGKQKRIALARQVNPDARTLLLMTSVNRIRDLEPHHEIKLLWRNPQGAGESLGVSIRPLFAALHESH
jgi:hypothetical protein